MFDGFGAETLSQRDQATVVKLLSFTMFAVFATAMSVAMFFAANPTQAGLAATAAAVTVLLALLLLLNLRRRLRTEATFVLELSPTELRTSVDLPGAPGDAIVGMTLGVPPSLAVGRRFRWTEIRKALIVSGPTLLLETHEGAFEIPVHGSPKTLRALQQELDQRRSGLAGQVPKALEELRR